MEKILTILIPAYNVQDTILQNVESLLVSDALLRNLLDILIVNDGSLDNTKNIAEKLSEENPGVVRVINKENGGYGSTINIGIKFAKGKYFKIVDGDDWLDTEVLEKFLKLLIQTDVDLFQTDYSLYLSRDNQYKNVKVNNISYNHLYSFEDIGEICDLKMPTITVRTDILRKQSLYIDEHCYYTDVEFDNIVAMRVKSLLYVDLNLYRYRTQQPNQSVSIQGTINHYADRKKVILRLVDWYLDDTLDLTEKRTQIIKQSIKVHLLHFFNCVIYFPLKEWKNLLHQISDLDSEIKSRSVEIYDYANNESLIRAVRSVRYKPYFCFFIVLIEKFKRSALLIKQKITNGQLKDVA